MGAIHLYERDVELLEFGGVWYLVVRILELGDSTTVSATLCTCGHVATLSAGLGIPNRCGFVKPAHFFFRLSYIYISRSKTQPRREVLRLEAGTRT